MLLGTATNQETLPGSEWADSSIKQDFGGESSEAYAPGALDGDLDDPELRRIAEKGGDTSSDEDYESSSSERANIENLALHESRTTYRKSFFSFRNTNSQPTEGPANNEPPPTPVSAPARSEPPSIGSFNIDHTMAQARQRSVDAVFIPSTSLSRLGSQGDESIAADPQNAQKAGQAPAVVADLRGTMTRPTATTAEANSVQSKPDHDSSTDTNPEKQKMPEARTLPSGTPDDATSNIPSGPAKFAISQYTDGGVDWKRASLGGRCIPLYYSTDMKSVLSKGGATKIKIDATELRTFVREIDEEQNGNGILTLIFKDTTTPPAKLVFDRDGGANNIDLGKKQARVFTNWLRDCGIRPGRQ